MSDKDLNGSDPAQKVRIPKTIEGAVHARTHYAEGLIGSKKPKTAFTEHIVPIYYFHRRKETKTESTASDDGKAEMKQAA